MVKYNNFIVKLHNITQEKEAPCLLEHEGYHEMMKRGRFDFPIGFYHVEKYHPRFNMPYHWHMEYELIRMLRGGFTISLNEETLHLVPGDIVFIRDGIVHGGVVDSDDTAYECLVFEPPIRPTINPVISITCLIIRSTSAITSIRMIKSWPLLSVSSLKKCNGKIPVMN